ncbi:MAG: J domain-containing protein [Acidobacteria bacterium]|nr:J domain-containing protein [Acidobacteriota bacterium]MCA1642089.1 J domain-containing protein [Acidobacteriota bacterium]
MADEMSRERCLEVLGLQPGASAQDFKTAYRDMAKVWHPDRFTHDPRLQQKAQEKLKEINDAYQQLLAGRFASSRASRATHDSPRDARTPHATYAPPAWHAQRAGGETGVAVRPAPRKVGRLVLVPALALCATFAAVTPRLLSSRRQAATPPAAESAATAQPPREAQTEEARAESDGALAQKNARTLAEIEEARRANSSAYPGGVPPPIPTTARALPTTTVRVDPATGMLARADCPHKMSVTFPAGDEPRAYCNAEHRAAAAPQPPATDEAAREKKSRLKSLAGRLASPTKWLGKDSQNEPAKKRPGASDQ